MSSQLATAGPFIADALALLGVFIMTIGAYGALRMPDTYTKLHATSNVAFGVTLLCMAALITGIPTIGYRAILIAMVLAITTPIATFTMARSAHLHTERMNTPSAVDESDAD